MNEIYSKYPMGVISVFFALGIGLVHLIAFTPLLLIILLLGSLVGAIILRGRPLFLLVIGLVFLFSGALIYTNWFHCNLEHPLKQYLPIKFQRATCIVLQPPQQDRNSFLVEIQEISINEKVYTLNRKFIFNNSYYIPGLLPGTQILIDDGTLINLEQPRNPGQFNYKVFLERKGVFGKVIPTDRTNISIRPTDRVSFIWRLSYLIRKNIESYLNRILDTETSGFIQAILLGKKEAISSSVREDFQNSGVAHVLAISGLHVGFIVYFFHLLLSFLPLHFKWQNFFTIILILLYMVLSGMNPPVIRATLMVVIYLIGINLENKSNVYNSLFTAGFIILVVQPQQLFNLSFQFSLTAVLSILIFYKLLKPVEIFVLSGLSDKNYWKKIISRIVQLFFVSLAAQLGTIPLMAYYFKQIPLISIFLNLPVIPLVGLMIPLSFCVILAGLFSTFIATLFGDVLTILVNILFSLVNLAASLPMAFFRLPQISLVEAVAYYLCLWMIFYFRKLPSTSLKVGVAIIIFLLIIFRVVPTRSGLEVLMLDVGQGNAVMMLSPGNKTVLYDTGPADDYADSGKDVILPAVQHLGKLHLDKVILSHPHSDHVGGLFSLGSAISIDSVYLPELQIEDNWQKRILVFLNERKIPYRFVKIGDIIPVDHWTKIYVLGPFSENLHPSSSSGKNINNVSLVCLVRTSGASIMLMGDTERDSEQKLLAWHDFLKCQVLALGHHGSITSSGMEFLQAVSADYGLISVGRDNHFDHPSPMVLERLGELRVKYFRTDLSGAVWLKNYQNKWEEVDWRASQ